VHLPKRASQHRSHSRKQPVIHDANRVRRVIHYFIASKAAFAASRFLLVASSWSAQLSASDRYARFIRTSFFASLVAVPSSFVRSPPLRSSVMYTESGG